MQTGFLQLELSQEELKDEIEELRKENTDFGQKFEFEQQKVCNFGLIQKEIIFIEFLNEQSFRLE